MRKAVYAASQLAQADKRRKFIGDGDASFSVVNGWISFMISEGLESLSNRFFDDTAPCVLH